MQARYDSSDAARSAARLESPARAAESLARYQLNQAITLIGPGPYQLVVLCLGGGVYMAEGSLLLMLSVIAKSLIVRWRLSVMFAGAMVSIIFCGLLAGTIMGGFMCDRYGRRMPILVTYAGIVVFLLASLMSPDILLLITAKFLLGVSLGFGVPAANAIVCESCPASHRSNVYSMTMVLFSLGQMYSAVVIWAMSPEINHDELHWRGMLGLSGLMPMTLGVFAYFFLLESPHWLLAQGQYSRAKSVIEKMADYKGNVPPEILDEVTIEIQSPSRPNHDAKHISSIEQLEEADKERCCSDKERAECWLQMTEMLAGFKSDFDRLSLLFSDQFFTTTVLMSYISFVSNFAYYGMIYGLPDTLKKDQAAAHSSEEIWSPAAGVFFSAVFEIPGVFIAILLGTTVGRKMNMTISFGCTFLALMAVIMALKRDRLENGGLVAVFCVKLFIASVFIVVYLYLLECYPTKFRATGLAFCMVLGRMGAFVCPFLYDGLSLLGVHHMYFFVIMACLVLLAAILSLVLPYETKDSQLMEDAPPEKEIIEDFSTPRPGGYQSMGEGRPARPQTDRGYPSPPLTPSRAAARPMTDRPSTGSTRHETS